MPDKQIKRWRWVALVSLLPVLTIYLYQTYYYRHYTNDDAYITFRYSRFLAMGRGPYYNIGEHVEGYSNFSLMLIMAPIIRFMGAAIAPDIAKLIGIACGLLSIILAFVLCWYHLRRNSDLQSTAGFWGIGAAGIIAVNPAFALNSTSGLETTLFAFLLMLSVFLATVEKDRKKWLGSGLAFGAAILTRPEGILLFTVFWLAQAIISLPEIIRPRRKLSDIFRNDNTFRILFLNGLIVTIVFASQIVFRLIFYDGEWLPNTYYAKVGGFWRISAFDYITDGILASFFGIIGIALSVTGLILKRNNARSLIPLGVIAATGCLLPLITGTDWMLGFRLVMPYIPLAASLVVIGWGLFFSRLAARYSWVGLIMVLACVPVLWLMKGPQRKDFFNHTYLRAIGYKTGHAALADWLRNEAAKPGDSIALMDIGIVGYLCIDQSIIDLTGLTDRFIAKSEGIFLHKQYDPEYILNRRPEFVVLTLAASGTSYRPISPEKKFRFWTLVEENIYMNSEFQKNYINHQSSELSAADGLTDLARDVGAVKIFEHAVPEVYYLLAVFQRNGG